MMTESDYKNIKYLLGLVNSRTVAKTLGRSPATISYIKNSNDFADYRQKVKIMTKKKAADKFIGRNYAEMMTNIETGIEALPKAKRLSWTDRLPFARNKRQLNLDNVMHELELAAVAYAKLSQQIENVIAEYRKLKSQS